MYGWSGSDPVNWRGSKGYDYGAARARYDAAAKFHESGLRVYVRRTEPDIDIVNPKKRNISSESQNPIILGVDITGSMSSWPEQIFDRLPLLYQTLSKYKEDVEFCFAAIGDATSNDYPLQINDFAKSLSLEKKVKALGCEGKGGDGIAESYEIFGYYMLNHCNTPKAVRPFLIMMGDEEFYPEVNPKQVKAIIGDDIQPISSRELWTALNKKYNIYFLQKPYGSGRDSGITAEIRDYWMDAIGEQRVLSIASKERAVDVAMGLIAKRWGEYEDFSKNLRARHDDEQVRRAVHNSLRNIAEQPTESSLPTGSKIVRRII